MFTNARTVRFRWLTLLSLLLLPAAGCSLVRGSAPVVDRSQDARIRDEVGSRLSREPMLERGAVRVEVDGRTVLLYGSVRGLAAWKCALRNAELVDGVARVVDYLILERGPREGSCLAPPSVVGPGDGTRDLEAVLR